MTRIITTALLATVVIATQAACSSSNSEPNNRPPTLNIPSATGTALAGTSTPGSPQEDDMRIEITIGDERFEAMLDDSPASRDLIAQLPLVVRMSDHGGVEKTGRLKSALSLDGQPDGADPDVGDVGYYAPGNDLVLYYGDQSYFNGIVVLGRMEGNAAARIQGLEGDVNVEVDVLP